MKEQTSYRLQWYAEHAAEWRDTGFSSRFLPVVQEKLNSDSIICGGTVTLRILSTIA
jgi:hypothetical protein